MPHLTKWLANDLSEVTEFADAIVVAQKNEEYRSYVNDLPSHKSIIDLVRITDPIPDSSRYLGLHW